MTADSVTAMALTLGISISGMEFFTVGGIADLQKEIIWQRNPEARVYAATQDDFDRLASCR